MDGTVPSRHHRVGDQARLNALGTGRAELLVTDGPAKIDWC